MASGGSTSTKTFGGIFQNSLVWVQLPLAMGEKARLLFWIIVSDKDEKFYDIPQQTSPESRLQLTTFQTFQREVITHADHGLDIVTKMCPGLRCQFIIPSFYSSLTAWREKQQYLSFPISIKQVYYLRAGPEPSWVEQFIVSRYKPDSNIRLAWLKMLGTRQTLLVISSQSLTKKNKFIILASGRSVFQSSAQALGPYLPWGACNRSTYTASRHSWQLLYVYS